jgi:hypothetical protein
MRPDVRPAAAQQAGDLRDMPWAWPGQTLTRPRPLRRRAERIARPALVRMRSRNPCVFARRRLFGWNVRLLTGDSRYGALIAKATTGARARERTAGPPGGSWVC